MKTHLDYCLEVESILSTLYKDTPQLEQAYLRIEKVFGLKRCAECGRLFSQVNNRRAKYCNSTCSQQAQHGAIIDRIEREYGLPIKEAVAVAMSQYITSQRTADFLCIRRQTLNKWFRKWGVRNERGKMVDVQ